MRSGILRRSRRWLRSALRGSIAVGVLGMPGASAGTAGLAVPNGSFESPETLFVTLDLGPWQRLPKPEGYVGDDWSTLTGIFRNTAPGQPDHIRNLDGNQALWIFAIPGAGVFLDSLPDGEGRPTVFRAGHAYAVSAEFLGGGGNMQGGAELRVVLEAFDDATNAIPVTTLVVPQDPGVFPDRQHVVPFRGEGSPLTADHPAVGRPIRIRIESVVDPAARGGYWDIDRIRIEVVEPGSGPEPASLALNADPDGGLILSWQTAAGARYRVEAASRLGAWTPRGGEIAGDGKPAVVELGPPSGSEEYYRVVLLAQ